MRFNFEIATGPSIKGAIAIATAAGIAISAIYCITPETGISAIITLAICGYFAARNI